MEANLDHKCYLCEKAGQFIGIKSSTNSKYICEECLIKLKCYGLRPLRVYHANTNECSYSIEGLDISDAIDNLELFFGPAAAARLTDIHEAHD